MVITATANEIQRVSGLLNDKEAIEILKEINDNLVTEEEEKGKGGKQNDVLLSNFKGFAQQEKILGEDSESEEFKQKQGTVKRLVDAGLIIEGFHIPLEKKSEKKFGDVNIPAPQNTVSKYKLTEEGFTLLAVVEGAGASSSSSSSKGKAKGVESNDMVPDDSKQKQQGGRQQQQNNNTTKSKAIKSFKEDIDNKSEAISSFKKEIKREDKL